MGVGRCRNSGALGRRDAGEDGEGSDRNGWIEVLSEEQDGLSDGERGCTSCI